MKVITDSFVTLAIEVGIGVSTSDFDSKDSFNFSILICDFCDIRANISSLKLGSKSLKPSTKKDEQTGCFAVNNLAVAGVLVSGAVDDAFFEVSDFDFSIIVVRPSSLKNTKF